LPELVHSELPATSQQRLTRMGNDVVKLREELTLAQLRTVYEVVEAIRDELSKLLDKVDRKNA
jgi:hypothetical protein